MNPQNILYLFIGLVIFNFIFTTILKYINKKNWKNDIPDELLDFYDSNKYLKAKNYKVARGKISLINSSLSLTITLSLLYFFGFGYLSDYSSFLTDSIPAQSCIFFLIINLYNLINGKPLS